MRSDRKHGGYPIPREVMAADEVRRLRQRCAAQSIVGVARAAGVGVTTLENALSGARITTESAAALRSYLDLAGGVR